MSASALPVTAAAAMVAPAFPVPLALLIREVARDRALTDAERTAQAVVPVLSVTDQPAAVRRALRSAGAGGRSHHGLPK